MKKIIRISTVPGSLNGLLRGQLRMLSQNYEIIGVSSPGKALDEVAERERIRVIAVPMERRISLWNDLISLWRLICVFKKERPDMVHSITPKAGLLSMLAAKIVGVPIRMHTFTGLMFPTATGLMQKLLISMDRLTCFCATHINPEGEGVKRDLISFAITNKPLQIIANGNVNGIDCEYFKKTEDLKVLAHDYESDKFTFIFVGRVVKDKGINELVQVFYKLYILNNKIRLIIVGAFEENLDPIFPETKAIINDCPGIEFVGYQKDIRPFLSVSNVLVLPSYREGFPNVVMQAGAMQLPCIVSDINGCNEIIISDINGIIVPAKNMNALYEAMEFSIKHPDKMREMGEKARPLVINRFEQHIVWNGLMKKYKELLLE